MNEPIVLKPTAISDAVQILAEVGPDTVVVSSAGHLMSQQSRGAWRPGGFVLDIGGIPELRGIRRVGTNVVIGAMVTFAEIMNSRQVDRRAVALLDAASVAGGPQSRHRHTIGGEIMSGSPGGDGLAALLALDARVVLLSNEGPRLVPLYSFYTGYRQPVATNTELLTSIEIPALQASAWTYHRKVAPKGGFGRSKVTLCGHVELAPLSPDGWTQLRFVRLGMGAVAAIPTRLFETERLLQAAPLTSGRIDDAARVLASEISPIDDYWSTAAYRRLVATNMLREFLEPLIVSSP